jgi:hypothetical protein
MKQDNFYYMFVGLLALLLLAPVIAHIFPAASGLIIQIALMTVMVIGVWSLQADNKLFITGIILAATGVILSLANYFQDSKILSLITLSVLLVFCILSAIEAMKQILFSGKIDANKLVGSICIYLLLGIIWSLFYIFIAYFSSDAFTGLAITTESNTPWELELIYYSFVTLTTLGYGDINPVSGYARSLAYLEAVCGQFYIAILVASLVSSLISDKQQENK